MNSRAASLSALEWLMKTRAMRRSPGSRRRLLRSWPAGATPPPPTARAGRRGRYAFQSVSASTRELPRLVVVVPIVVVAHVVVIIALIVVGVGLGHRLRRGA